ncbi:MAG: SUMF1/EgtB/PvdO family nonheme iron enzyme [Planctomycetota bacterium]|jgi:formylglycine-generating enzyme required for sulfatase activity
MMYRMLKSGMSCVFVMVGLLYAESTGAHQLPEGKEFVNSIGMKFVRIEAGEFRMGQLKTLVPEVLPEIEGGDRGGLFDLQAEGDYDEKPVHTVKITKPFYMGVFEVTNKQFELFDPDHRSYRGKYELSTDDDEAVIYVSWYDARGFCQWLSDQEGLPYRLATEAEWEYACRAGTTTNYYTGDVLTKEYTNKPGNSGLVKTRINVGKTLANPWGLHDTHGNVEEWCYDWYGPYTAGDAVDPVGYADGDFKVSRGGSYGTYAYFLRSANRLGTLPNERQWLIGFRVVIGELPKTEPLPMPRKPLYQRHVIQRTPDQVKDGPDPAKPYFKGPRKYVRIARDAIGPLFAGHNHSPHITACPNGDLIASWFTCVSEKDREMGRGGSRLRWGQEQWEPASVFWDAPDRNDSICALWTDEQGKIYNFVGSDVAATYAYHALGLRTSTDNAATWSKVRIFNPEHRSPEPHRAGHWLAGPVFRANDGAIAFVTDGWPTLWYSHDDGLTWQGCEGDIKGNHPGVVQLRDGTMLGFTRGGDLRGPVIVTKYDDLGQAKVHSNEKRPYWMPKCVSDDLGKTWTKTPSIFKDIGGGQRLAMIRLKEGPIFFASFADRGIIITDKSGAKREVRGLYAAVSEDEGETWSNVRLVSDDGPGRPAMTTNGGYFALSRRNAEYRGYLAACQAPNGLIHLISSYSHYAFNLAWLKEPMPPLEHPQIAVKHEVETFDGPNRFDLDDWEPYHGHAGGFNGKGQYTMISRSHFQGMNRLIGAGSFEMNMAFENIHFNPRGKTASPGITIWIKDAMMRRLHFYIRDDRIDLGLADEEDQAPFPRGDFQIKYETPPTSAKLKFTYNEETQQVRIFYGLNGAEATTELGYTKAGLYFGRQLSESTAVYIMFSNGRVDLDHFEIKPR